MRSILLLGFGLSLVGCARAPVTPATATEPVGYKEKCPPYRAAVTRFADTALLPDDKISYSAAEAREIRALLQNAPTLTAAEKSELAGLVKTLRTPPADLKIQVASLARYGVLAGECAIGRTYEAWKRLIRNSRMTELDASERTSLRAEFLSFVRDDSEVSQDTVSISARTALLQEGYWSGFLKPAAPDVPKKVDQLAKDLSTNAHKTHQKNFAKYSKPEEGGLALIGDSIDRHFATAPFRERLRKLVPKE